MYFQSTLQLICILFCLNCVTLQPIQAAKPLPVEQKPKHQFTSPISEQEIRPHIEYLASEKLAGRSGKSAMLAARYIRNWFEQHQLRPLFNKEAYFQEIPHIDAEGKKYIAGRNVAAWLPGSDPKLRDEYIIISAHYDHLGIRGGRIYRGADDNASGVSMMLAIAKRLSQAKTRPRRSVVFIGFDLEEQMLWGSRWFAAHTPWPVEQIKLFITADMIGRSLGDLPMNTVFIMGSEHAPLLKKTLDDVGSPEGLETARLGIDLIGTRSDYGPFRDRKIPFLFFSSGEHPDYHTPRDIPEKIEYKKVARISGLVYRLTEQIASANATPVWTTAEKPDLDEARALYRISSLVIKSQKDRQLTDLQLMMVTQAQLKARQIIERGSMSAAERQWLIRLSQFMLLSIF